MSELQGRQDCLQVFLDLDLPFFEPRNERRGGWSGVSRVECADNAYFIKRQFNHAYREPRRGLLRTPTLHREYRNYQRLAGAGIGTAHLIRYEAQGRGAILVTQELAGYQDLGTQLGIVHDPDQRLRLVTRVALTLNRFHRHYFSHGCLYGKHIMVSHDPVAPVAIIDLEKVKRVVRRRRHAVRDIAQLFRYTPGLTQVERDRVTRQYETWLPGFARAVTARMAMKLSRRQTRRRAQ